MIEADILAYFGVFLTSWAIGFSIAYKILNFKKFAESIS